MAKSTTLIKRWAAEDDWQERVRASDAELDMRCREQFTASAVDASRQQANTAARIRLGVDAFARSFLDELAAHSERGEDPFADLTPSQKLTKLGAAARAQQHAQHVARLSRGLSTESVGGGDVLIPPEIARKSMRADVPCGHDLSVQRLTPPSACKKMLGRSKAISHHRPTASRHKDGRLVVKELIPLSFGLLLGSVLGMVRPSLRLSVGAAMAVALGFAATVMTGEAEVSWGYLLIDIPTVAVAAALGWTAGRHLGRFRSAR